MKNQKLIYAVGAIGEIIEMEIIKEVKDEYLLNETSGESNLVLPVPIKEIDAGKEIIREDSEGNPQKTIKKLFFSSKKACAENMIEDINKRIADLEAVKTSLEKHI